MQPRGAFTTLNAFGLEGEVPGAWVDSPPFLPKVVFAVGLSYKLQDVGPEPYKFKGFGAMDGPEPYEFIGPWMAPNPLNS